MSIKTDKSTRPSTTKSVAAPSSKAKALASTLKGAIGTTKTKAGPVDSFKAAKPTNKAVQLASGGTVTPSQWAAERGLYGVEATKTNANKYGVS